MNVIYLSFVFYFRVFCGNLFTMTRCIIIGGADIKNYEYVKAQLSPEDFFLFCDSGLKHADALGVKPSLIVGDFDSYDEKAVEAPGVDVIKLPRAKDDTDTFFAAKEALRRGFSEFLFVGVIGNRLDHSLGNVSILVMLATAGLKAIAVDDYSEMEAVVCDAASKVCAPAKFTVGPEFPYFSIICLSDKLTGVTITGAKFPLDNATITPAYNFAVSNEVTGPSAAITIESGTALIVRVR